MKYLQNNDLQNTLTNEWFLKAHCQTISDNWKSFQIDEKAFHFTKKALFVLNIFEFLFYFGYVGNWVDEIAKLIIISNFMTSQTGKQTITIPNISRSKGNQAMKFGQLI